MSEVLRELLARERLAFLTGLGSLTEAKKAARRLLGDVGEALVYNEGDISRCLDELEYLWTLDWLEGREARSEPPCLRVALARGFRFRGQLADHYMRPVGGER